MKTQYGYLTVNVDFDKQTITTYNTGRSTPMVTDASHLTQQQFLTHLARAYALMKQDGAELIYENMSKKPVDIH